MYCPHCGNEHPNEAEYCPVTGRKIYEDQITTAYPKKQWYSIGTIVAVLVIIGILMLFDNPASKFVRNIFSDSSALIQNEEQSSIDLSGAVIEDAESGANTSDQTQGRNQSLSFTPTRTPYPSPMPLPSPTPIPLPGTNPVDGAVYSYIPAGEFQMGSEGGEYHENPVHTIYLDSFWIGQAEVTNAQYAQCVAARACDLPQVRTYYDDAGYAYHPVVYVDWYDAQSYCVWAGGGLPTEAQWEKAARGGLEGKLYPWGDDYPSCKLGATNGAHNSACDDQTVAVGSFSPNGYGLYDMAGNVWEWVADWYDGHYYSQSPVENPPGPEYSSYGARVLRGGSWESAKYLRVASRLYYPPDYTKFDVGFRCALSRQP